MPPKKKGQKKSAAGADGEGGIASSGASDEAAEATNALTNVMLKSVVNDLEQTKAKLLVNVKDLKEKLAQQKEDQADIYYYLNKKCDDSYEIIASLEEQLLNEQMSREVTEKQYEKRYEDLKHKFSADENRLQDKIDELEKKLHALRDFGERKEDMVKLIKQQSETIEEERMKYAKIIRDLEHKSIFDREALRKEHEQTLETVRKDAESKMEELLPQKTKETRQAYEVIKQELNHQSKQADLVLEVNQQTLEKFKALQVELSISRSAEKESIARLTMYQKTIKGLNEKLASDDAAYQASVSGYENEISRKENEIEEMKRRLLLLQDKSSLDNVKMDEMWAFVSSAYDSVVQRSDVSVSSRYNHEPGSRHEMILLDLVDAVVRKYPSRFAVTSAGLNRRKPSVISSNQERSVDSPSLSHGMFPPLLVASRVSTGIEAWDSSISTGTSSRHEGNRTKPFNSGEDRTFASVAVQTDSVYQQPKWQAFVSSRSKAAVGEDLWSGGSEAVTASLLQPVAVQSPSESKRKPHAPKPAVVAADTETSSIGGPQTNSRSTHFPIHPELPSQQQGGPRIRIQFAKRVVNTNKDDEPTLSAPAIDESSVESDIQLQLNRRGRAAARKMKQEKYGSFMTSFRSIDSWQDDLSETSSAFTISGTSIRNSVPSNRAAGSISSSLAK